LAGNVPTIGVRSEPAHGQGVPAGHQSGFAWAFPSDHATLFSGLAAGLLLTERRLGIAALVTFQVANLFEAARAVFWSARR
jgi:hypothetical protein